MQEAAVSVTPPGGPAPVQLKVNRLTYEGQTGSLYGLWLTKIFLTILTLGVYHFWGKAKIRRYLIGAMELDGDRFEFLGTGKEMFVGFLKVVPFYIAIIAAIGTIDYFFAPVDPETGEHSVSVGSLVFLPLFLYIVPVALYNGFRYRVNRLSWRGVRAAMRGSASSYGWLYLRGALLCFFTLGIRSPSVDLGRWEYQVRNMQFGNQPFGFRGDPARLRKVNIVTLLLLIPTLGIARTWYKAALQREQLRGLTLGPLRFRSTVTAGALYRLMITNFFILVFTLFLGTPFVMQRNMRFFAQHIAIGGDLAAFNAQQAPAARPGEAEGMMDMMDVDIGMIGA